MGSGCMAEAENFLIVPARGDLREEASDAEGVSYFHARKGTDPVPRGWFLLSPELLG